MPQVIESYKRGGAKYDLCLISCGKSNCSKCPHGPYWYVTITLADGRTVKRYIGKNPPKLAD